MYFVYILKSQKTGKMYVGSSDNPKRRLIEHNAGKTSSTKNHKPYELVHVEEYNTKTEAIKRERLIKKSGRIRKELKLKITASSSNG